MSRPVGHELDQLCVRPVRRSGLEFVEQPADCFHHVQVRAFAATPDAVGFADSTVLQGNPQCAHVILDVQPVAHVVAAAVDRQPATLERIKRHERYQLFRELARTVVVRAVREDQRQPIRVVPRAGEVVRAGLGRRIGRARAIRARLGEGAFTAERAEHLIGRYVQETELACLRRVELVQILLRDHQQCRRANQVGRDEIGWSVDRAIDMRLGGEVHHGARLVPRENVAQRGAVADIDVLEAIARIPGHRLEGLEIAGIRELVDVDDLLARLRDQEPHESRADEARSAGHQDWTRHRSRAVLRG
jgi:hypothetical protein